MKKILTSKFFLALVLNLAFLAFTLIFTDLKNETNDDPGMAAMFAGAYGDAPDPKSFFVNSVLGYILYPLYLLIPRLNWFVIAQQILSLCAFTGMTYILLARLNTPGGLLLSALFVGVFSDDAYIVYQYTQTSGLCVYGGVLLLAESAVGRRPLPVMIVGCILIFFGAMFRLDAFLECCAFALLLGFVILEGKERPVNDARWIFCLLSIILCLVGSYKIQQHIVHTNDYSFYASYNGARTAITDYHPVITKEDLKEAGLDESDYSMFRSWMFYDPDIFSLPVLHTYNQIADMNSASGMMKLKKILDYRSIQRFLHYPIFLLSLLLLILIAVFHRRRLPFALSALALGFLLYEYLLFRGRVVYQAEFIIWLGVALVEAWLLRPPLNRMETVLLCFFVLILVVWKMPLYYSGATEQSKNAAVEAFRNNAYDRRRYLTPNPCRQLNDSLHKEMQTHPENLYMIASLSGDGLRNDAVNACPLYSVAPGSLKNQIPLGGWLVYWPPVTANLRRLGAENPFKSVVNDNVYVVGRAGEGNDELRQFLERHYYDSVTVNLVKTMNGVNFYKYKAVQ